MEQGHVQAAQGAKQVVYQVAPPMQWSNARHSYAARNSKVLGALQIIIGILCICIQTISMIIALVQRRGASYRQIVSSYLGQPGALPGFWCGAWFILAGSFGISAGKKKTTPCIVTFMVVSSIAVVMDIYLFYTITYALIQSGVRSGDGQGINVRLNAIFLCLTIYEGVIAICSAAVCWTEPFIYGATSQVVVPHDESQPLTQAGSHPQVIMMNPVQTPGDVVVSGQGQQAYYSPQGPT